VIADRGNKERKKYLARRKLISCGLCPYNRRENAKRKPKGDKHKDHRR
jgi:hypothetical protein